MSSNPNIWSQTIVPWLDSDYRDCYTAPNCPIAKWANWIWTTIHWKESWA